jgi:chemotaxis protein methyltransferase CheR
VNDGVCVRFLQWALPRMGMRWRGFRKVRRQVCRRIRDRMRELGLEGWDDYRAYLEPEGRAAEWDRLESLCGVTISRFRRDREVFRALEEEILPALAQRAAPDRLGVPPVIRAWSVGCASGEEPYTLSVLWRLRLRERFPGELRILATDRDPAVLDRARAGRYPAATLRELPGAWVREAFRESDDDPRERFHLRPSFREAVELRRQDVRRELPRGPFDLVLCRNLVFTYFDEGEQGRLLGRILERMTPGGALVLGSHETPPPGEWPLRRPSPGLPIWILEAPQGSRWFASDPPPG